MLMNVLLSTLLKHLFFVSYAIIILLELPACQNMKKALVLAWVGGTLALSLPHPSRPLGKQTSTSRSKILSP
jgi:hypothetical protein